MIEGPRICDYEDSSYRTDFWEGQGRDYEDMAERIALRRLLPATGRRLLDIGAAFGRLSEFYSGYDQVVLLDYSSSLLREAQARLGRDGRFVYVATDVYDMPLADTSLDAVMMVRVMHHISDVPALLHEVERILSGKGCYVLEYASKKNLKSILRYALRRQQWSPFDPEPYEFVEMNFDFHPTWMRERLAEAGFHVKRQLTVSHFRLAALKRLVPAPALASLDGVFQLTGRFWQLTPSVFAQCGVDKVEGLSTNGLFRCPTCHSTGLQESAQAVLCPNCQARWPIEDGIYSFKAALPV